MQHALLPPPCRCPTGLCIPAHHKLGGQIPEAGRTGQDTAGTAAQAANALAKEGARRVALCCTHGVLSSNAVKRIEDSLLEEVVITDTIPHKEDTKNSKKIKILSIADLLGEAIRRIAVGESISTLFS